MRQEVRTAVIVFATGATLAVGGGIAAWASWTVTGPIGTVAAKGSTIPVMAAPEARLVDDKPEVSWTKLAPTTHVDGYVVVRDDGTGTAVACTVAASAAKCADSGAIAGSTVTYRVRATLGPRWTGVDSPPSAGVTLPASAARMAVTSIDETPTGTPDGPVIGTGPVPQEPVEGPTSEPTTPSPSPSASASTEPSAGAEPPAGGDSNLAPSPAGSTDSSEPVQ